MMWPPKALQASRRKPGFLTAAVPMMMKLRPSSR
jgi:hypothetical protein